MARIKLSALFLFIAVFLSSCSCEWHIKKAKSKCGLETETITVHDTVTFPEVRTDSVFFYNQKDTVLIQKGNIEVRYFYSNDSVFIDGTCKEVTVVKERVVTVNKFKQSSNWPWFIVVLLVGFIVALFVRR